MAEKTNEPTPDTRSHGEKIRETLTSKYGEDYYSRLGKVGGKNSNNRPFRDKPGAAKRAVNIRWKRYHEAKAIASEEL